MEVHPSPEGSYRPAYPNYRAEGWIFEEGFNPATHEFTRVRMVIKMYDTEKVFSADVQRISEKPDQCKNSKITLIERMNGEVLNEVSNRS